MVYKHSNWRERDNRSTRIPLSKSPSTAQTDMMNGYEDVEKAESATGTLAEGAATVAPSVTDEPVLPETPPPNEAKQTTTDEEGILVTLDGLEDPQNTPPFRKWMIVITMASAALCVTCSSSLASFTYEGMEHTFGIPQEVAILTVSLYVAGLGVGPLLLGPLSEFYGRQAVYYYSYIACFLFTLPVAFAPNAVVLFIFRFITGFAGSAFLSVGGGTVSDLFPSRHVANPTTVYATAPFLGPAVGPLIGGFINQYLDWRWTFYVLLIWTFVELVALLLFVPETYHPVLLVRKAHKLRKETGDSRYYAPLERSKKSVLRTIEASCYKPFLMMWHEPMVLLLNIWTALILGILYLSFNAWPIVFTVGHHFSIQDTGLSFLGIGVGIVLGTLSQFLIWSKIDDREWEKYGGPPPPESRLYTGMAGAIAVPLGLFWFGATSEPSVHWIVPIIGSISFGIGFLWVFTSVFTYLVITYRPHAASAMASNAFMRSAFATVFPLISTYMYGRLGTVGATCLLAGLTLLMTPLPFIFFKYGPRIRKGSHFAPH